MPAGLCHSLFLSEFDIDRGSVLRHRYPEGSLAAIRDDWFAEHQIPEGAHNRVSDETVGFLQRSEATPLYFLNLVSTRRDKSVRRGAIVKALGVATPCQHLSVFRAPLILALDRYFDSKDGEEEVLRSLFAALNGLDTTTMPRPLGSARALMWRGVTDGSLLLSASSAQLEHCPGTHVWPAEVVLDGLPVKVSFPLYTTPDEVLNLETPALTTLCQTLGPEATMRVFNAIVAGERVMFVGHQHSAQEVSYMVLAAAAMVSPPLSGMIMSRVYPYANLTDMAFLEARGFVAGVTNPVFEGNPKWWDLCVVLNLQERTATVVSAEEKAREKARKAGRREAAAGERPEDSREEQRRSDLAFAHRVLAGIRGGLGEDWVRSQFRTLTWLLVDLCGDEEPSLPGVGGGQWDRLRALNALRLAAFRASPGAAAAIARRRNPWAAQAPEGGADGGDEEGAEGAGGLISGLGGSALRHGVRRLALGGTAGDAETARIFTALVALASGPAAESALQVLLTLLPEADGGLTVLSAGLLHGSRTVRDDAAAVLRKLRTFQSTAPAVASLNPLFLDMLQ